MKMWPSGSRMEQEARQGPHRAEMSFYKFDPRQEHKFGSTNIIARIKRARRGGGEI